MKLSLIVRGQHPPGDTAQHLHDDLDLVRRADRLGFDGIVKGSHYSAHPFESVQQIPFLVLLRGDRAAASDHLRPGAGAVAQAARSGRATGDARSAVAAASSCSAPGIGYRDVEFKAFGVPRGGLGARFEECLTAIRRLWTEDFVDMKGTDFELDHATCSGQAAAKTNAADLDRRQCRCRDPARGAARRLLVHQPAQHAGDDRAADGSVQARARRIRPAVSRRSADAARGFRRDRPAPRRSASRSRISRRSTKPIAPGVRTR